MNFPGSYQVPILTPHLPPRYFGFGPIYSNVGLLSIAPMVSLQVSERLAIGGGPIITSGTPSFSPAFFAPGPKDALGISTFPAATNSRPDWGAGFQVGLFYELADNWNLGFSYKSPVWQEKWDFNASTPRQIPRVIGIQAGIPEILSWGVAYKGFERTLIDVDLRYIDYANTPLFGTKVVDGGLGWQSVFAVALGIQHKATEKLSLLGRLSLQHQSRPQRDNTLQRSGPRDHHEYAFPGCLVQHHRRHHGLARLGSLLPQLVRGLDSAASGILGPARCADRYALDGLQHQIRPQETNASGRMAWAISLTTNPFQSHRAVMIRECPSHPAPPSPETAARPRAQFPKTCTVAAGPQIVDATSYREGGGRRTS